MHPIFAKLALGQQSPEPECQVRAAGSLSIAQRPTSVGSNMVWRPANQPAARQCCLVPTFDLYAPPSGTIGRTARSSWSSSGGSWAGGGIFYWGWVVFYGVAPILYGLAIALTDLYPKWQRLLRWFVLGQSAVTAQEARLERKRVLRALLLVRQAMVRDVAQVFFDVVEVDETYLGVAPPTRAGHR